VLPARLGELYRSHALGEGEDVSRTTVLGTVVTLLVISFAAEGSSGAEWSSGKLWFAVAFISIVGSALATLAYFGALDPWTPAADIDALRAAWNGRTDCEIVVVDEADHGFVHDPDREVHRADDAARPFVFGANLRANQVEKFRQNNRGEQNGNDPGINAGEPIGGNARRFEWPE